MKNISDHITYYEATRSDIAKRFGISNTPNEKQLSNMEKIAINIFEPLRLGLGEFAIYISSFFRSLNLNKKIKGAKDSQHLCDNGAALDLDVDGSDKLQNHQIFNYIKDNLEFDQLIWEFGDDENPDWVHVSFNEGKNRGIILVSYYEYNKAKNKNEVKYKTYRP